MVLIWKTVEGEFRVRDELLMMSTKSEAVIDTNSRNVLSQKSSWSLPLRLRVKIVVTLCSTTSVFQQFSIMSHNVILCGLI